MIAHAHLLGLFADPAVASPDEWTHDLTDGSLTYRFRGSSNTFTWASEAVASIAVKGSDTARSGCAGSLLDLWEGILGTLRAGGISMPDRVVVEQRELTLLWDDQKLAVIVERPETEPADPSKRRTQ